MRPMVFFVLVAVFVAVAYGYELEETQAHLDQVLDEMYEVAKRGKDSVRSNPFYTCRNPLSGAKCICNKLYRKSSKKHQVLCTGL